MKPKSIAAADGQQNVTKRQRNRETETETGIGIAIDVGRGLQMEMGIEMRSVERGCEGANKFSFGRLTCACWAAATRSVHRP